MSLPPDTPQGIADTLGYLQHHLHKLTERQNVSKNNINTTLVALTVQLQQLTQLVANPPPPPIPNTLPPSISSPLVSPPPALIVRRMHPKLSSPDFSRECHNGCAFLNSCSLYICLAPEQFHDKQCKGTPNTPLRSPFQSSGATRKLIQYYIVILGLTPIIPRALRCHPAPFPCSDPGYQCRDAKTL